MDKGDIPFLPVTELSRLIATKKISPVEVTEAYLERIDSLDFKFNSYLTVCRTEALQAAESPSPQSWRCGPTVQVRAVCRCPNACVYAVQDHFFDRELQCGETVANAMALFMACYARV